MLLVIEPSSALNPRLFSFPKSPLLLWWIATRENVAPQETRRLALLLLLCRLAFLTLVNGPNWRSCYSLVAYVHTSRCRIYHSRGIGRRVAIQRRVPHPGQAAALLGRVIHGQVDDGGIWKQTRSKC